ncbi:MAG: nuclear transport factor 2 family protein [Gammaproteobacteria bacterium]|nr:nuclear transport factor 2 family protein [Gammaproteobacteria bacterium]MBI5619158.1 nuclear transport factor 2 family protein [Gammaproteobacteria bacterium]
MPHADARIPQLLARYCHAVDRGTPEDVAALFADTAVLRPHFDGPYEVHGREAIRGWYAHYDAHFRDGVRHLKHMISSIAFEVSGARAAAQCYFTVSFVTKDKNEGAIVFGTYTDVLACVEGHWLFADRLIETSFLAPGLTAVETFPSLGFPGAAH